MLVNAIARRYAQALFAIAEERNIIDQLETEFTQVMEVINYGDDLKKIIAHQLIGVNDKKKLIGDMFEGKVDGVLLNFIYLLISKHRENLLPEIYQSFSNFVNESRNIQDAEVRSAKEISEADLAEIKSKLASACGKNIRLTAKVDPSLKGGIVARVGDKVIDGSVVSRIESIKTALMNIS